MTSLGLNARAQASTSNALLVLDPRRVSDNNDYTAPRNIELDAYSDPPEFNSWAEDLTFNMFLDDDPKRRYRLIDLAIESPLFFLPNFNGYNYPILPDVRLIGNMSSHVTQLQFLQLAVALLSNNRTDGSIEDILAELCLLPRNLAFVKKFLSQNLSTTRCFADQLLLPAVKRQQLPLIKALLKAGANPLTIRWQKDFELQQLDLAAWMVLRTDRSGRVGGTFRDHAVDSPLSLAVQLQNEAIIDILLENLGNAPLLKRRRSSFRLAGSQLGFELAMLEAVDCNRPLLLRSILEADYVKKSLVPLVSTAMPKILEYAIATHRLQSVDVLLSCLGTLTSIDQKALNMALSSAAHRGQVALVEQLIDLGAEINPKSELGCIKEDIPLGLAVKRPHTDMVRLLLERGADPNLSSESCARPLQIAAMGNHLELVEILLKAGADPNEWMIPDSRDFGAYNSALKWAVINSSPELFFLLVRYGADVREPMTPRDTHSVLTFALMSECMEIVNYLLDQDVRPLKDKRDRSFQACVHFYDFEFVQRFLSRGVELDDTGALCAAIFEGKDHIVDFLLRLVETEYGQLPPGYGAAGLALAAQLVKPRLVRLFLHHGIRLFDKVQTDIHRVAKYESRDWHGQRRYLSEGTCALVEVTKYDSEKTREHQIECLDILLEHAPQPGFAHEEQEQFQAAINSALWRVSYHKDLEMAKVLVKNGANCFEKSSPPPLERSALESAAEGPEGLDLLRWFLEDNENDVREAVQLEQKQQAIDRALTVSVSMPGCLSGAQFLLKNGANINFSNCEALRLTISRMDTPAIKMLLEFKPAICNIVESSYNETYMQKAVLLRDPEIVGLLLQAGADHYNVSLALQEAVKTNNLAIVKMLLNHGADVNVQPRLGTSDMNSVQHAARNGNFEIMKMLLDTGGNINAPRHRLCGRTALEGAAEQGFLDMARFLLEMGAEIQGRDNKVYRRSVYRAWSEGNMVVADMIQDFKKARYGLNDCVSVEEIVETMDPFELEIEPYAEGQFPHS